MRFLCLLFLSLTSAPAIAAADPTADLFVAPAGNDSWSGRLSAPNADGTDGPFATIDAARMRVRELRKSSPDRRDAVRVMLRGGFYPLSSTVAFTADDSGSGAASPTIYKAWPDETPILSGGVTLTGWKVGADGRWTLAIDDVKAGKWNFSQLFANGQRRMRPRAPKEGYFHIASRVAPPDPRHNDDRFRYTAGDIQSAWKNLSDIEVTSFHPWFTSMLRIRQIDADLRLVSFTGHTRSSASYGQLSAGMRYLVDNVAEALDEPGEWYLDRPTGVLTYIPLPGETPENTTVIAPRLEKLVSLESRVGQPPIEHLHFEGLTFSHTNWVTPADGSSISQAAVTVNAAVSAANARHLEVSRCAFTQLGTYGLEFGAAVSESAAVDNRFVDLGAGGVKVGITRIPGTGELTQNIVVKNNLIAHLGRIHPAAVGVWIGHAADITVEHNDIYDLCYTGISTGWAWGYQPTQNRGIRIRYNHIHHIGQAVLSDMAGIYTLGASPDSVLEFNRIHDITRDKYGGWGIYYDEGSAGYVARNNLLYRLQDGGFHQHYGEDNRFENNIILDSGEVAWGPTRLDSSQTQGKLREKPAFCFERNIISGWGAASVVRHEAMGKLFVENPHLLKVDRNLYWNGGAEPIFRHLSLADWRKLGHDVNSVVAEIRLGNPDDDNFHVPEDSPAKAIGFKPFDVSKAGRLTREPADLNPTRWPRWFPPSAGGPKRIVDDFEVTPVGAQADLARTSEEPPTATLRVTDAVAYEGKRSLKFTDAPKLKAAYNPHLCWTPNYRDGVATARFALRSDGAAIAHEWRGSGHPYATGPAVFLNGAGKLRVGQKEVADVLKGTWITVEITCPLGGKAGKYDVRIQFADGTMKDVKGVPCSPDFRELSWFGFSAVGDTGDAYLDALQLDVK